MSGREIEGSEFDWFAVDGSGHLGRVAVAESSTPQFPRDHGLWRRGLRHSHPDSQAFVHTRLKVVRPSAALRHSGAKMWYFKMPGRVIRLAPSGKYSQALNETAWGRITQYLEVADDQCAVRQVDEYENGNLLRYDRDHRLDEYGLLIGRRFSWKPKWGASYPGAEILSPSEFERVWSKALLNPAWRTGQ